MLENTFTGFEYPAHEISKYLYSQALGLFTVSLKANGKTVHFTPEDPEAFKAWLQSHNIPDIKQSI